MKFNFVSALTNVGLGVTEAIARKTAEEAPMKKGGAGCTPCDARAYAASLMQKVQQPRAKVGPQFMSRGKKR